MQQFAVVSVIEINDGNNLVLARNDILGLYILMRQPFRQAGWQRDRREFPIKEVQEGIGPREGAVQNVAPVSLQQSFDLFKIPAFFFYGWTCLAQNDVHSTLKIPELPEDADS